MQMEKYKFIEKLGRGTHGTVYLLEGPYKKEFVCKSVIEKYIKHAKKEVEILSMLSHKRIIRLIEFVEAKGSSFIILEYANRGTLETVISFFIQKNRRATDFLLWSVISQVAEGLRYLHSKKIIHRDIKPSNILINSLEFDKEEILEFKICDFSLSNKIEGDFIESSIVGTPFYMAPEIVNKDKYNYKIDIWGLGVTVYELGSLKKPFKGETRIDLYKQIKKQPVNVDFLKDVELKNLILSCLSRTDRISATEILNNKTVQLNLAKLDVKIKDKEISELKQKIKFYEKRLLWPPTPNK